MQTHDTAQPFYSHTRRLFDYVTAHDFDNLAALCDDDFGIVDLGPAGENIMVRTRAEWEGWFKDLFAKLTAMEATTDTEILAYNALETPALGYSVVEFCQNLRVGGKVGKFMCVATIIWKLEGAEWKESRWHVSLLSQKWGD